MSSATEALETLRNVTITPRLIEDYRPLTESLEWRLSELYWNTAGTAGFVQSEIPYTITSSGALSLNAARVLFANCEENPPQGPLQVLEIGAGTGLFARLFLEEFRRLCESEGRNYYEKLVYHVTDRSARSREQWKTHGLFDGLPAAVGYADALDPLTFEGADGKRKLSGLRAVLANYSLDSLPSTVLRKGPDGCEELCIRTHLTPDAARVKQQNRTLEEIREMAREVSPDLIPLVTLFEFEAGYRPAEKQYQYAAEALTFGHDWPQIILNYGAIQCLEKVLAALDPHGFALINDYGMVKAEDAGSMGATQRFGNSAALGLNFPFLEFHFTTAGTACLAPTQDELAPIHARLLTKAAIPDTRAAFHNNFDWSAQRLQMEPQEQARKRIEQGSLEGAKQCYEAALSARPRDWVLLGEIAEFLIRQVSDYQAGLNVAQAALAVNPWYSVWLWNVYGDALYALDQYEDAHEAYRKAEALEPGDVRTNLNLGYSYGQLGKYQAALESLSRGLAGDRSGIFRERLMEKMQQILVAVTQQYASEQEWLARRAARLLSAGGAGQGQGPRR